MSATSLGVGLLIYDRFRAFIARIPQSWLITPHLVRLLGINILILAEIGYLPNEFAIHVGYGDILSAVLVPIVVYLLMSKNRWAIPALVGWNIIGLIDFFGAITAGPRYIPSFMQAIEQPYALNYFVLVPLFILPIILLTHVYSLMKVFIFNRHISENHHLILSGA